MTFKVTPEKYISTIATIREMGMEKAMTTVGRRSRRNSSSISTASTAPSTRFCKTVSTTM